jgi:hypothetical protein
LTPSPSCTRFLKENFFLQTKEEDNDPYESSQFSVVIANQTGIYGLYSYREVFEFKEFWGIGSGRSFALGAMHAPVCQGQNRARSRTGRPGRRLRIRPQFRRTGGHLHDQAEGGQMSLIEIKVPDIGDFDEVAVIEVLVKVGDTIKAEQSLITVESDKASMEIPSAAAGVVKEVKVKLGDKVKQGLGGAAAGGGRGAAVAAPAASAPVGCAAAPAAASTPAPTGGASYAGGADLECDVLVLGGGPGGYSAAFRAADLGLQGGAGRALCHAGRRLPERGLHPVQGAAARGGRDGRGEAFRRPGRELRRAHVDRGKLLAHKNKVVGKLTGGLTAMAKMRKVTVVRGYGQFLDPYHLQVDETTGTAQEKTGKKQTIKFASAASSPPARRRCACPSCRTTRAWWTPPARWRWAVRPSAC